MQSFQVSIVTEHLIIFFYHTLSSFIKFIFFIEFYRIYHIYRFHHFVAFHFTTFRIVERSCFFFFLFLYYLFIYFFCSNYRKYVDQSINQQALL